MRDRIGHFLTQLLGAGSSEVGGIIVLFTLIGVGSLSLSLIDNLYTEEYNQQMSDARKLDSLISLLDNKPKIILSENIVLSDFDPNTAGIEEFINLGLDSTIARNIIKYRNKGGSFKKKSDLAKIYGLSREQYESLQPFILLPTVTREVKSRTIEKEKVKVPQQFPVVSSNKKYEKFDLNTADTATYQTIYGIGSVLSDRIVRFRNKLGGFVDSSQLYEVYNLDTTVVEELISRSFIEETFSPTKFQINQLDEPTMAKHPYVSYRQAKLLTAYRNQHGPFNTENDLLEVYSIDEEFILKMKAYISFEML